MRKLRKKQTRWGRLYDRYGPQACAFLIPFVSFLIIMLAAGCEPFSNARALLYSDEYHQYYPFFLAFRNTLRNGDSLLYNWQIGGGIDFLGLMAYYLGSPLNWLSVLVPESLLLEYFTLCNPIRLGFASLFFAIMLKRLYGKQDISIALFGSFYALCAWALAYQWNVMWLDTFALLPLVVLGTISLLRDKKFILYTLSLFLSITINYYVGLFTCIFVLLVFICYQICRCKSIGRFFTDLLRIALFSVIAIGMTAFLELPALVALGSTSSNINEFPDKFRMNIVDGSKYVYTKDAWAALQTAIENGDGFLAIAKQLLITLGCTVPPILDGMYQIAGNMGGGIKPSFMEGLPNIYSGTSILVMSFLFLTAKKVKVRDKICSVALLVFFMISFLVRQLDYVWHGCHFPNQIPHRFSFLFSFVIIWMAYRAWLLRDEFNVWQLVIAGILSVGVLLCHNDLTSLTYLGYNGGCVLLTLGLFAFILIDRKRTEKRLEEVNQKTGARILARREQTISLLLCVVMIAEVGLNVFSYQLHQNGTDISSYPRGRENSAAAFSYMKFRERDNLFYRAEVTHTQTYNDAALNNYNGITTFTSSANVRMTDFMKALGYGAKRGYNRYAFEEGSPVGNLFLNLKYMIERKGDVEDNAYFDTVHNFDDVYLLENNAYLPLGFLAESDLANWDLEDGDTAFDRQSELFRLATGLDGELWRSVPNGCVSITSEGVQEVSSSPNSGRFSYKTGASETGTVTYGFTATEKGLMCLEINAPKKNDIRLYKQIDGIRTELYSESMTLPQVLSVSEVEPGDLLWLEVDCDEDENGTIIVQTGILNEEVFRKGYNVLAHSTLELTDFSNTRVEGTIRCNRDGLLYTSIPNNGFWYAEVDGEPVDVVLVGGCMTAVELTKGEHTVVFRYRNSAFTTGLLVSLCCTALFVAIIFLSRMARNRKGQSHGSNPAKAVVADTLNEVGTDVPVQAPEAGSEETAAPAENPPETQE